MWIRHRDTVDRRYQKVKLMDVEGMRLAGRV
jgi:hypothetical protein